MQPRNRNANGSKSARRSERLPQTRTKMDRETSPADIRSAIAAKVSTAVLSIIDASSQTTLLALLASPTAVDALIGLVSQNSTALDAAVKAPDPLREARSRAAQTMSALVKAEGGPIGAQDVADRLGISRAAVDKRRKSNALLGIQDGSRVVRYPSWQFTATGVLRGLPETLGAIGVEDPWMRLQFFLSEDLDLETTPLQALRNHRTDEVVAAATRYGRQGEDA